MSQSTKHFIFFIPFTMISFGMMYGAGVGAISGIIAVIFMDDVPIGFAILCSPVGAFAGVFLGIIAGSIIGLIDSFFVSIIILFFWRNEILWRKKQEFRAIIIVLGIVIHCLLVLCWIGSDWVDTGRTIELIFLLFSVSIATILGGFRFCRWHTDYLIKHPDILHQMEIIEGYYIEDGYDHLNYVMPPLPADLTQYADGELPAELLRQFPIDRE